MSQLRNFGQKRIARSLDQAKSHYTVLVIGSGYGAGVAASRLARAGQDTSRTGTLLKLDWTERVRLARDLGFIPDQIGAELLALTDEVGRLLTAVIHGVRRRQARQL